MYSAGVLPTLTNNYTMRIPYKRKRSTFELVAALLWGVIAIYGLFISSKHRVLDYGALFMSIAYLLFFLLDKRIKTLTIKNGVVRYSNIFKRKIMLSEVIHIESIDGILQLKTDKTGFIMDTKLMSQRTLAYLNDELEKYSQGRMKIVC